MSGEECAEEKRPDIATRFAVGNEAWKARSSHGRKPIFESPEQLEEACEQYFHWVNDNPEVVSELAKHQGSARECSIHRRRNMSEDGLKTFLDISNQTWVNYRENPDFLEVTEKVVRVIRTHKMDGAIIGVFKENIIARELGLTEKQETTVKGSLAVTDDSMTLEDATRIYEENLKRGRDG